MEHILTRLAVLTPLLLLLLSNTEAHAAPTFSADQLQRENARIALNALPEIQKKLLQSKFEKIRYSRQPMVELFSPRNANELTDPLIVIILGDNKAPLESFPELVRPLHKLMKSHYGLYFFKGYYADDSKVSDKDLPAQLLNSLTRVRSENRDRTLHVFGYGKGRALMKDAISKMEGKDTIKSYDVSDSSVEALYTSLAAVFAMPKVQPDRRSRYRCCLTHCPGGPAGGNHELEIGHFLSPIKTLGGVEYPAYIHAFGAAADVLKFDDGLVAKIVPQAADPNYYYFTFSKANLATTLEARAATGMDGDHLLMLNLASPREAYIWRNYGYEFKAYKKAVTPPLSLRCEQVKTGYN